MSRDLLLRMMDDAYDHKAWHGPNLRGAVRGLTANQAFWKPAAERHSIWELVLHCAYWKYAIRRRLTGEKRGSFTRKGSNWLPMPEPTEEAWREDVKLLEAEHRALRETIASMSDRDLQRRRVHPKWDIEQLIYGIISHDIYHTGQIQLLKRLYGVPS